MFVLLSVSTFFFFFNDTATTEIYTLSLHDALPICHRATGKLPPAPASDLRCVAARSEEHTSELQSHSDLVCRLLLEKKKNINITIPHYKKKKNEINQMLSQNY